jgi:hypothetical protein
VTKEIVNNSAHLLLFHPACMVIHILKKNYDNIIWNCIKKFLFHETNDTIIHKSIADVPNEKKDFYLYQPSVYQAQK